MSKKLPMVDGAFTLKVVHQLKPNTSFPCADSNQMKINLEAK